MGSGRALAVIVVVAVAAVAAIGSFVLNRSTGVLSRDGAVVATVQDGDVCWDPDVEFPVPCDDED